MTKGTTTLESLLHNHGFTTDEIEACATIIFLSGAWDGKVKGDEGVPDAYLNMPVDSDLFHSRLQDNLFKKFRGQKERQQITKEDSLTPVRERLLKAFTDLGFLSAECRGAERLTCEYGLIFGASQVTMSQRINTFLERVAVRAHIIVLVGARPLWIDAEPCCVELLAQHYRTTSESGAIASVSQEAVQAEANSLWASAPEAWSVNQKRAFVKKKLQEKYRQDWWPTEGDAAVYLMEKKRLEGGQLPEVRFIEAPCKADGSRPDTIDTVVAFVQQYQDKLTMGSEVVAMSSYPHVREQALSLTLLPNGVEWQVIGHHPIEPPSGQVETLLAGFAGYFYKYKQVELLKSHGIQHLQSQSLFERATGYDAGADLTSSR